MTGAPWWVPVLVALITTGGLVGYIRDALKYLARRRQQSDPERKQQEAIHTAVAQADASLLVVAKSRDELLEDNQRLREERREQDSRHAAERAEWAKERAELKRDIEAMENRLRTALNDLGVLKARHSLT
jgi:hypothetical protein